MLKKFLSFVLYGKSFSTKERKDRLLKRTYEACRNYEADNANRVLNEILSGQYEAAQMGYFRSPKSIRKQAKARRLF